MLKVPMKRGPPSRDANFADFGSRFSQDFGKVVYSRFPQDFGKVVYSRIWVKILTGFRKSGVFQIRLTMWLISRVESITKSKK